MPDQPIKKTETVEIELEYDGKEYQLWLKDKTGNCKVIFIEKHYAEKIEKTFKISIKNVAY